MKQSLNIIFHNTFQWNAHMIKKGSIYKSLVEVIHNSFQTTKIYKYSNHLGKKGENFVYIKRNSNESSTQYYDAMGSPSQNMTKDWSVNHLGDINILKVRKLLVLHGSILMDFSDAFINSM